MITGKSLIGYRESARGTVSFRSINPQSNEFNPWTFIEAAEDEVNEACELASKAFQEFRRTSGGDRAGFLSRIADELLINKDELIRVYCIESGLPEGRALAELNRTVHQLKSYGAFVSRSEWDVLNVEPEQLKSDGTKRPSFVKKLVPLGPVVVFGASNFPFAYSTAGGDTASALAAACPVIVKSHPMHPATGELVARCILRSAMECGMPEGVFSNLNASGFEPGQWLVKHPKIKAVGFTGSEHGGRALFDLACKRSEPIPVYAEMGSTNPVIISEEAIKKNAAFWANTYADSITQGSGQFCTKPGLLFVKSGPVSTEFTELLASELSKRQSTCMLHPEINRRFVESKASLIALTGVKKISQVKKPLLVNYAEQTILSVDASVFLVNSSLHKEVFGPCSMVVHYQNLEQLIELIESLDGQLTGTVIIEPEEYSTYTNIIESLRMRVGRLILNGVPTGVEVTEAMHHGGPYPATTDSRFTAVGPHAIYRWLRPVVFQNFPEELIA